MLLTHTLSLNIFRAIARTLFSGELTKIKIRHNSQKALLTDRALPYVFFRVDTFFFITQQTLISFFLALGQQYIFFSSKLKMVTSHVRTNLSQRILLIYAKAKILLEVINGEVGFQVYSAWSKRTVFI